MFTVLDQIANRNHLQLIKAAIPYVNASSQKTISLLVKMMEIQNIIRFYDSGNSRIRGCDTGTQSSGILDMLTDIRSYCEDENEQMMIDQCIQMLYTIELYAMFAQSDPDPAQHTGPYQKEDE